MSCCIIYYGENVEGFTLEFAKHGAVISLQNVACPDVGEVTKRLAPRLARELETLDAAA